MRQHTGAQTGETQLNATANEPLLQLDDTLLGEGLPETAKWHLAQAAASYRNSDIAERHLHDAVSLTQGHPAVLIGLYRFYFYKGRLTEALAVARTCLSLAADYLNVARDWHQVRSEQADFGNYGARLPRFYLFTLKACAYLQLRLGQLSEGNEATLKLLELDPTDKVGATVLIDVLQRERQGDDD